MVDEISAAATPLLSARGLSLAHGGKTIYDCLDISFGTGLTAILGPNGAGKTTLIDGLLSPGRQAGGDILMDGTVVSKAGLDEFYAQVGHMPQAWKFFRGFTAVESVQYVAWLKRVASRKVRAAAERALSQVDLTDHLLTKVHKMSGGMRQRVGLAEAFVNSPRVVLLDEPTVGLDPAQRNLFRQSIRPLSRDRAVILSTHLTDDVELIADRVLVVNDGSVVFDGTPDELKSRAAAGEASTAMESGYLAVVATEPRTTSD